MVTVSNTQGTHFYFLRVYHRYKQHTRYSYCMNVNRYRYPIFGEKAYISTNPTDRFTDMSSLVFTNISLECMMVTSCTQDTHSYFLRVYHGYKQRTGAFLT